jgi:hypothetical protein
MEREEVYNEIEKAFTQKFSWLGKQFSEEFLLSCASYNIQQYSQPPFRVRRHPLLFWIPGWMKSSMLMKAYDLLGPELCTYMSDVTRAAMRGSVDGSHFVVPATLRRPFAICTEFGQMAGGDSEMIQHLLNALEEGVVNVNLIKIGAISIDEMQKAERDYNIKFADKNSFSYHTNWVLMAATYNKRFLIDNAFESRFSVMSPKRKLDSGLIKHVLNSGPFTVSLEAVETFREEITKPNPMESISINLPEKVYDYTKTMRDVGLVVSTMLCKRWWGFEPSDSEIIQCAKNIIETRAKLWRSNKDKIWDALEEQPCSREELAAKTGLSLREVHDALYQLKLLYNPFICEDGVKRYEIK